MVQNFEQTANLSSTHSPHSFLSATAESSVATSSERREKEATEIEQLEKRHAGELGARYVRRSWWEKWRRYAGYPAGEGGRRGAIVETADYPGPIEGATDGEDAYRDCVPICRAAWELLLRWYPATTNVEATSENSSNIQLLFCSRKRGSMKQNSAKLFRRFPRTATMDDVLMRVTTDQMCGRYRWFLFDPVHRREFFLRDERTLAELQIENNAVFCLLSLNELGMKAGKVGLMNIGNTCYMNSSLQCLLHTPELMQYFLLEDYKHDIREENPDGCGGKFAEAFNNLMRRIWTTDQDQTNPYHFWSVLSEYYGLFAEKDQHDAAELAETVLDGLMEDCNLAEIPKPYYTEIKEDPSKSDSKMAEECWSYHKGRSSSFITDRFHGQYRILTTCPDCDFESRKFDSFTVLHLGLPPPRTRVILFTLIEVCGDQLPRKYGLELSSNLLVKDLYLQAARLIKCEEKAPWEQLCFVLNRQKLTFLQLQDPIGRIRYFSHSKDVGNVCVSSDYDKVLLYSYKGCTYGPSSGGKKTCFVHQKMVVVTQYNTYCYPFTTRQEEKQEFGYPLVLWLPHDEDDWNQSKKRTFQGNLDILENSLRPFKRLHMAALQEEEQKEETLYNPLKPEEELPEMECDASDQGSTQAQPTFSHSQSRSRSSGSDLGDVLNDNESVGDQIEEEEHIPDAVEPEDGHLENEQQNDMDASETSPRTAPVEVEMTTLPLTDQSMQGVPMVSTSSALEHEEVEEGEEDKLMGNLFEEHDSCPTSHTLPVSHTNFAASSSSTPTMHFGASSASEAYSLFEPKSTPRADEARTIVVDWDSNADQFYNLQTLECPLLDKSAEGVEDRRQRTTESVTIYDCLTHEFSPHPCALDGDNLWKCGGCQNMVNGVKSMRLWKTPDILLIGLKRFDYCEARDRLIKLKQMVRFPLEGLDLSEFYAPLPGNEAIYDLYGVCHHLGDGPKVGHYTSCVKSPRGKWHKFNDSWVTEVDAHSVLSQDAYLLFYRKRNLNFRTEEEILHALKTEERRALEEQAVKLYEQQIAESMPSVSDDDNMSTTVGHPFGKDACNGRMENGSSSSNEMNNENDVAGISPYGQGSSSTLTLTAAPHSESFGIHQGSSSGTCYGPENRPDAYLLSENRVFDEPCWGSQNDTSRVSEWNGEADMQIGSSHEETEHEETEQDDIVDDKDQLPSRDGNSENGTLQPSSDLYEPALFEAFGGNKA